MLTFTKDKEIPFVEIIDFHLPSDFPHHTSGGHSGSGWETCIPGAVPWGAEEGFWVSVTAAAVQVREACRPPHSAGWSPHNG